MTVAIETWVIADQGKSGTRLAAVGDREHPTDRMTVHDFPGFRLRPGEDAVTSLVASLTTAVHAFVHGPTDRTGRRWGLAVGTTGAPPDRATLDAVAAMVKADLGCDTVVLSEDSITAHLAAFDGGRGTVVSAGTGTVALYADDHDVRKVDGWGPLLGDNGSSYWVGHAALRSAVAAAEGWGPATALTNEASGYLGGLGPDAARRVETSPDQVALMVDFVPRVIRSAERGDRVARAVLEEAGHRLATVALAARGTAEPAPIMATGRLVRNEFVESSLRAACEGAGVPYLGRVESPLLGVRRLALLAAEHPFNAWIGRA